VDGYVEVGEVGVAHGIQENIIRLYVTVEREFSKVGIGLPGDNVPVYYTLTV
jgi:hypothetical protein